MLIDTHVHIYHEQFDSDREEAIRRAIDSGVGKMILPAIDIASIYSAIDLCESSPGLYAMSALHPSETREASDRDFDEVRNLCGHPKVVAIGETGLDYYWDRTFDEVQQEFLRRHIRLAVEVDLPLVFHNRDAGEDLIRILTEERERTASPERLRGVFHCFGGPPPLADAVHDLGFHYGIGGTLTFKNSGVDCVARTLPLERIVLETDAPFLAPSPHRGKRNEPAYLTLVAQKLADIKETSVDVIEDVTTRTAERLFGI